MNLYATAEARPGDLSNNDHQLSYGPRSRFGFTRIAEQCFAIAMRAVPRRLRFRTAVVIARAAVPCLRRTAAYREQQIKHFHNPYEISLYLVLNALTKNATAFEPVIVVKGFEEVERARTAGTGVLVVGHHAALTLLMIRFFYDRKLQPIVVTPDSQMHVAGTCDIIRTIQPSPSFLLKIRSSLRQGEVVCAMPDRAEHEGKRTIDFEIAGGQVILAPAIMQLATRCGAKIIFAEIHAERNRLAGTLTPRSAAGVDTVTDDFVDFVRATTASARPATGSLRVRLRRAVQNISGRRLVVAAALLHVTFSVGIFAVGRTALAPALVDRDGIMPSFAFDSYEYQNGAVYLANILARGQLITWVKAAPAIHVKLISISYALLGPIFGYRPLSAEPFNVLCYTAIVGFVFALGREIGGSQLGVRAAAIVALWPSLLLHSLQLLKDPLFIAVTVGIVFCLVTWLTRIYARRTAIAVAITIAVATLLLNFIRFKYPIFIVMLLLMGVGLLVLRQLLEQRLLVWNVISLLPGLALAGLFLAFHPPYQTVNNIEAVKHYPSDGSGDAKSGAASALQVPSTVSHIRRPQSKLSSESPEQASGFAYSVAVRVNSIRAGFSTAYPDSGSLIDANREFKDLRDVISYLPRALEIGSWAPFPNVWLSTGRRVGSLGKLLSTGEMILIYLFELSALYAIVRSKRDLPLWLLLSIAVSGFTALGLLVPNLGALYRLRFAFWILLITIGTKGLQIILAAISPRSYRSEPVI